MKDWKIIEDEEAKVRIRTGVVMLCRHLRSRSATLAQGGSICQSTASPWTSPGLHRTGQHSAQRSCCTSLLIKIAFEGGAVHLIARTGGMIGRNEMRWNRVEWNEVE